VDEPTKEQKKLAITQSIEHWTNDHLKLLQYGGDVDDFVEVFNGSSCALCQLHFRDQRDYSHVKHSAYEPTIQVQSWCGLCPLSEGGDHGCTEWSAFDKALTAYKLGDERQFMDARQDILDRLDDSLKELNADSSISKEEGKS
tara:strand:- start:911 stop:1339 length:429 start_codon:yes stop_codon:yes gene_type:complete